MESYDAFDHLIRLARQEQEKAKHEAAVLLDNNNFQQAHEATNLAQKLQRYIEDVRALKQQWEDLRPQKGNTIQQPLPGTVYQRTPPGKKTPQEKYRVPILKALVEIGGKARVGPILDRVGEMMDGILNDFDRKSLPSGKDIRWRNTAMWERNTMREEGFIAENSPIGIWEITDKGRRYLQEHQ